MKLEDQLTSLELSKRLKELGVKQDSLFYWCESLSVSCKSYGFDLCVNDEHLRKYETNKISAFTAAELGEMLHDRFSEWAQGWCDSGCFYHFRFGLRGSGSMIEGCGKSFGTDEDQEANARAVLIIYLIENNLSKP